MKPEIPHNLTMEQAALYQGERPERKKRSHHKPRNPKRSDSLCLLCMAYHCQHISPPSTPRLTRREINLLLLVLDGHSNKEIAARTGSSHATIKSSTGAIYRKFRTVLFPLANRITVAIWAHEHRDLLEKP